jgi:uncharacterized protein (DUF1684 family)
LRRALATLLLALVACSEVDPEQRAYVEMIMQHRTEKDRFMQSGDGPLTPEQRGGFKGLAYYTPNPGLIFDVELERSAASDTMQFVTSTNTLEPYLRLGVFRFAYAGREHGLALFEAVADGTLFLPFADETTGHDTYGGGRYLDPQRLQDGRYRLDFNLAYSPYCAYNSRWICPLPPAENRLELPVEAGERNYPYATH